MEWEEKILTADEVAVILRVLPKTVRVLLKDGKLPGVKVGRVWRIREEALKDYLAGRKNPE